MHEQSTTNILPGWPELMDLGMAGAYLSLSERSLRMVAARAAIKPVDLGLRLLRYRKSDLDRLVEDLTSQARNTDAGDDGDQLAEQALARVAKRGRTKW